MAKLSVKVSALEEEVDRLREMVRLLALANIRLCGKLRIPPVEGVYELAQPDPAPD